MAFRDGLGERRSIKDAAGASLEALCLRRELAAVPSFEFALRERVTRLANFHHAYYGRVRSADRSPEFDQALTIVSETTPGIRLSALLDTSHELRLPIELDVALYLIRQLVPAVAILHETARDASHGAIAPERLIVTPNGRLVIVEYVLGSALEQLLFTRERYWTELRVALPRVAGLPRFDHLADVTQIGIVALSLILGRTLRDDEYPARIGEVVAAATVTTSRGDREPLSSVLRSWLQRALQLDPRNSFPSAIEARAEFERALGESGCDAASENIEAFLKRYHAAETTAVPIITPAAKRATPLTTPMPTAAVVAAPASPAAAAAFPVVPAVSAAPASVPSVSVASEPKPVVASLSSVGSDSKPSAKAAEPVKATFGTDASDTDDMVLPASQRAGGRLVKAAAVAVAAVVLLGGGVLVGARRFLADEPAPAPTGTLVVTTNPAGAEAFVDGVRRGNTPLTVELLAGAHNVELRGRGEPRVLPVSIAPGQHVAQYVDLPIPVPAPEAPAPPAPAPPTADHEPADAPVNAPGWIAVNGKFEVQLFEAGHLLGSSKIERIMVPAGRHDLELINELVGYRGTRSIQVVPGKVTTLSVDLPKGTMAINALPWAEVWMDGAKIGETPIGNFTVPVGSHDVVFRHPDFGEQRETVMVTLKAPVRLSVDMRKP